MSALFQSTKLLHPSPVENEWFCQYSRPSPASRKRPSWGKDFEAELYTTLTVLGLEI